MIRAVLDTNVLVSAILTDGTAASLMRSSREGRFVHVTSAYILEESRRVMTGKLGLSSADVEDILLRVASTAEVCPVFSATRVWCCHPADDAVVETAVRGGADYLVTGDKPLLAAGLGQVHIVTLRAFADLLD